MIMLIIKTMTILTQKVNFFLKINLDPLRITTVMLQLQIKIMILILLQEVENLKNIIKLTITTATIITKVTIMKKMTTIIVVKIIS